MKVLQWRRGRLLKTLAAGVTLLVVLGLILKHAGSDLGSEEAGRGHGGAGGDLRGGAGAAEHLRGARVPHKSYPEEIPVFKGPGEGGGKILAQVMKKI